jgi:hypothetical protein
MWDEKREPSAIEKAEKKAPMDEDRALKTRRKMTTPDLPPRTQAYALLG